MNPQGPASTASPEVRSLRDLSPQQWKSGIAAWLGWLFDGLDMHLYVLVAAPFVAQLIGADDTRHPYVGRYSSWIQAAFLVGWALGGGFFGRVGDRIGRSRALSLTILTYALFTGLAFFAQTWWQLLIVRFLAALGIGGEWAVGASLLSETWPSLWRPWVAAVLQTGVNVGILLASLTTFVLAGWSPRVVFLVGVLPALFVLWIRREVPETDEWHAARDAANGSQPGIADLFRGGVRRTAILTILVCSVSLSAHWAFIFWYQQHLRNLPDVIDLSAARKNELASTANMLVISASIAGNFLAAGLARATGYRLSIAILCLAYSASMVVAYAVPRGHTALMTLLPFIGASSGLFALFTMYLPPLFPTLLRTTGAGFCYNIGRIAAAVGTVVFGLFSNVGDYRLALLCAGLLFVPAALLALRLPEPSERETGGAETGQPFALVADRTVGPAPDPSRLLSTSPDRGSGD
jgi:MFS family permease